MVRRAVTLLDLFAGCGGMTRGFTDEGFRVKSAVEKDIYAAATYAANFGEVVTHCSDVESFVDVPKVDVVIGGPPCQGFSNLGSRDPTDERNRLWREFVRIVVAANCDIFVLENVERFSKSIEFTNLRLECAAKQELGDYTIQPFTLNAVDFGVPQRRIRSIIVGSRIGPIDLPDHTHARVATFTQNTWRTVRDAIFGLQLDELPTKLPERTRTFFDTEVPGEFKLDEIHMDRTYRPESKQRYALIPPGGSRFDLPEELMYDCWKTHTGGATDVLGRLEWDKPSVTIRTEFFKPEKGRYLHPEWSKKGPRVNRAITHAEAALLQGFDARHLWCGGKIEIARQIGNAVPPRLAVAIAKRVADRLHNPVG
jgi:DNA (cytosine-5)-methyltransferase 1